MKKFMFLLSFIMFTGCSETLSPIDITPDINSTSDQTSEEDEEEEEVVETSIFTDLARIKTLSTSGSTIEVGIPSINDESEDTIFLTAYIGGSSIYTQTTDGYIEVMNADTTILVSDEAMDRGSVIFEGLEPRTNYKVIFIGQTTLGSQEIIQGSVSTGDILITLQSIDEWSYSHGFWNLAIDKQTQELIIDTTPNLMAVAYDRPSESYSTRYLESEVTAFTPWEDYGYSLEDLKQYIADFSGCSTLYYMDYQYLDDDGLVVFFRNTTNTIFLIDVTKPIEIISIEPPLNMTVDVIGIHGDYQYLADVDRILRIKNFDSSTVQILDAYDGTWEKGPLDIEFSGAYVLLALGRTYAQHLLAVYREEDWKLVGSKYCRHAYRIVVDNSGTNPIAFVSHGYDVDSINVFALDTDTGN